MLTGGRLHSCLHRVSPCPGRPMEERYSVAYLQRTEDDVKMEALPGCRPSNDAGERTEVYTSREWLEKKFGVLRRNTWKEDTETRRILSGSTNKSSDVVRCGAADRAI